MSGHAPVTAPRGIGRQFSSLVTKILEFHWLGLKKTARVIFRSSSGITSDSTAGQ